MATHVERSIEVGVPVRTAYDQWTQFEEFPRFMSGVQEVRQIAEALTHWVAEIGGVRREWDAAILEQVPDEKVAWAATTGATNAGAVYFTAVGPDRTRVRLTLDYEPEGIVERIGDILDVIDRQAVADLDRFKEFIEQRGSATGGWRGTVEEGGVQVGGGAAAGAAGVGAAGRRGPNADAATSPSGVTGFAGPGARSGTTEATTDPVGESWSGDPGAAASTGGARGRWADESQAGATGATTDPVGESWSDDAGGRSATTDPGPAAERRDVRRDFANREIPDDGEVQRDFANRDLTEEDIENRGVGGMSGAQGAARAAHSGIESDRGPSGDDPGTGSAHDRKA